jgi:hypothetical protein
MHAFVLCTVFDGSAQLRAAYLTKVLDFLYSAGMQSANRLEDLSHSTYLIKVQSFIQRISGSCTISLRIFGKIAQIHAAYLAKTPK